MSDDKKPLLSPALAQFLRRRVMEIAGLVLVIAAVADVFGTSAVLVDVI